METLDFTKNFSANADIADLEKLGWEFNHDQTASAMSVTLEEARKYNQDTYHIQIRRDERGLLWRFVNTQKLDNGIDEGSDSEETGDDEQTIKDLEYLQSKGKLWGEKNI